MNEYEEKLKSFIKENGIDAKHMSFEQSCHSVEDACSAVNGQIDDFIKSICMISRKNKFIVAIVMGQDRASTKRVAAVLGIERPTVATPEIMLEKTGYPFGGTPPFGYDAIFLIDSKVMEKELVYAGGGSNKSLILVSPSQIQKANKGKITRIRKYK